MRFGATPAGIQTQQLPEIVIEMTLQDNVLPAWQSIALIDFEQDFHGNLLFKRTERAQQSTDPAAPSQDSMLMVILRAFSQLARHLRTSIRFWSFPLHAAGIAGMEELTQENLWQPWMDLQHMVRLSCPVHPPELRVISTRIKYSGELTINVFDSCPHRDLSCFSGLLCSRNRIVSSPVWFLAGNGGMGYEDYYWGLYRDDYRDPFLHSLLRTTQSQDELSQRLPGSGQEVRVRTQLRNRAARATRAENGSDKGCFRG